MERLRRHPAGPPALALLVLGSAFIAKATFVMGDIRYSHLFDDAMITLRYGRTLADGFGFAWNPGESHLEGFSSLAYVLLAALVHLARVPEPLTALVVSGVGLGLLLALVWVVAELTERLAPGAQVAGIAAWLTALCWPLVYWTLRGFEVGACALVVASVALLVVSEESADGPDLSPLGYFGDLRAFRVERNHRRYLATSALLVIGILLRDDQLVPLALVVAFSPRRVGLWAALAVALAAKTGWRIWYFDAPLPLTYYLKLEGIPLATRLARGSVALLHELRHGLWLPALASLAAVRRSWMPLAAFASACAYSVWVGGDAFEATDMANRFVTPALPLAIVGVALAVAAEPALFETARRNVVLMLCLAVVSLGLVACQMWLPVGLAQVDQPTPGVFCLACLGVLSVWHCILFRVSAVTWGLVALGVTSGIPWFRHLAAEDEFSWDRTLVLHGLAFRSATTEDATIAVVQAGTMPYFAHRRTIDELGRSEAHIAHMPPTEAPWKPGHTKYDPSWTLGRLQPDLVDEVYAWPWNPRAARAFGYDPASGELWIRHDTTKVDRNHIAALAAWDSRQRWP